MDQLETSKDPGLCLKDPCPPWDELKVVLAESFAPFARQEELLELSQAKVPLNCAGFHLTGPNGLPEHCEHSRPHMLAWLKLVSDSVVYK